MKRREYSVSIKVNGKRVTKVIIDPHYELKHSKSINDDIIVGLVKLLNNGTFPIQDSDEEFEYFVTDNLDYKGRRYKLVWLLENNRLYIGIINAHRRK